MWKYFYCQKCLNVKSKNVHFTPRVSNSNSAYVAVLKYISWKNNCIICYIRQLKFKDKCGTRRKWDIFRYICLRIKKIMIIFFVSLQHLYKLSAISLILFFLSLTNVTLSSYFVGLLFTPSMLVCLPLSSDLLFNLELKRLNC